MRKDIKFFLREEMNCMHVLSGRPLSRCPEGRRKLVMFMLPVVSIGCKVEQSNTRVKRKYAVSA
jgi:hypothetical protein